MEAAPSLGGHARTVEAGRAKRVPVDTGFIVFNDRNYPLLNALFEALDVPTLKTDMSFAVSMGNGAFEYSTQSLAGLFADKRLLASRRFWGMLRDIKTFNDNAVRVSEAAPEATLADLLDRLRLGSWFRERYLLPLSAAIWSTSTKDMLQFPARALTRFCDNHGLLSVFDQPQWSTVDGGSRVYVQKIADKIRRQGGTLRTNCEVAAVQRKPYHVEVRTRGGDWESFDDVVIATHSDQALAILSDADAEEKACFGSIRYARNTMVLHDDARYMPKRKSCWASWVFQADTSRPNPNVPVTYWMNRLQGISMDIPLFVTLNPVTPIDDRYVFDRWEFAHPQFDQPAIEAQSRLKDLNGRRRTWFCGAYARNGFHEDGLWSGARVAKDFNLEVAWSNS